MAGVPILDVTARCRAVDGGGRCRLYATCLGNHEFISLWDFADGAAARVVGWYLLDKPRRPLFERARSARPIERRTAITASFRLIRQSDLDDPLALARLLLDDPSDLVARPVGTALREVGKIDQGRLLDFLSAHRHRMSRPTFRLATSLLPEEDR